MAPEEEVKRVTVFEAVNDTAREVYLGITAAASDAALKEELSRHPLPAIAHWNKDTKIILRLVERDMLPNDAHQFLKHYADTFRQIEWKILTDS